MLGSDVDLGQPHMISRDANDDTAMRNATIRMGADAAVSRASTNAIYRFTSMTYYAIRRELNSR